MPERNRYFSNPLQNSVQENESYVAQLEEQVIALGQKVLDIAEELPDSARQTVVSYVDCMAELEYYIAILSYQRGKADGASGVISPEKSKKPGR